MQEFDLLSNYNFWIYVAQRKTHANGISFWFWERHSRCLTEEPVNVVTLVYVVEKQPPNTKKSSDAW